MANIARRIHLIQAVALSLAVMMKRALPNCLAVVFASALALSGHAASLQLQHPEQALNQALDALARGNTRLAISELQALTERMPNFRAAQLLYADLLAARSGQTQPLAIEQGGQQVDELVAELQFRRQHNTHSAAMRGRPANVLQMAADQPYLIVVDMSQHRLFLLSNKAPFARTGEPVVIADFYISIGSRGSGKLREGDNRTPVGVYTIVDKLADKDLPPLYGAGAYPVDYPNAWDRSKRRSGAGIWLHGVPAQTYTRSPRSSRGCVSMANSDFQFLDPYVSAGETPVILAEQIHWSPASKLQSRRNQLLVNIEHWRQQQSENKQPIRLSNISLLAYPGEKDLVEARFDMQVANGNVTSRKQYWKKGSSGSWAIVREG